MINSSPIENGKKYDIYISFSIFVNILYICTIFWTINATRKIQYTSSFKVVLELAETLCIQLTNLEKFLQTLLYRFPRFQLFNNYYYNNNGVEVLIDSLVTSIWY